MMQVSGSGTGSVVSPSRLAVSREYVFVSIVGKLPCPTTDTRSFPWVTNKRKHIGWE